MKIKLQIKNLKLNIKKCEIQVKTPAKNCLALGILKSVYMKTRRPIYSDIKCLYRDIKCLYRDIKGLYRDIKRVNKRGNKICVLKNLCVKV